MQSVDRVLEGRRILVVEDETYVAFLLEDMLADLGCEVVGVAATVEHALELAGQDAIDAGLLDVNVGGREVFPVAERLADRGLPVVFSTGYGASGLPARWVNSPVVSKPFMLAELEKALREALA